MPVWQAPGMPARDDDPTNGAAAALDRVGPRLRQFRRARELTLATVAGRTGISASTLSRLEGGRRRATLELLLPLARTYDVSLDDLVQPPTVPDPRVRSAPFHREGLVAQPLTRSAGGLQAFKITLTTTETPELQVHDGSEWLYVLSGRLRLWLAHHDLVLSAGEAAEFDTRVPHAMASTGPGPVELLSLFGPQGERMHLRTRTSTEP